MTANIDGSGLKAHLHDKLDGIELAVDDFCSVGSYAFDLDLAFSLARHVDGLLHASDCDGVVVTHGTDTMEESAYMADLVVRSDKPVVFTGAQRHAGEPDSDGPRNIADAARVAAAASARRRGAMIVFEQEIHAARNVTKTHTSRVDTFRSPGLGKIGEIDGEVFFYRAPPPREPIVTEAICADIAFFKLVMGSRPDLLEFAASKGARGVVIEAFGRGNAPDGFPEAIRRLASDNIPVVVASRCPEGRTKPVYGNSGGGKELADAGAIFSGDLAGVKAQILLSVLVGKGMDLTGIGREIGSLTGSSGE